MMAWVPEEIRELSEYNEWIQTMSEQQYESIQENCDNLDENQYNFMMQKNIDILLKDIQLDKVMVNTLKYINPDIDIKDYQIDYASPVVGNRLDRIDSVLHTDKQLDPIVVETVITPEKQIYIPVNNRDKSGRKFYTVPEKTSYRVLNGRHRVVAAILKGHTTIKADIQ